MSESSIFALVTSFLELKDILIYGEQFLRGSKLGTYVRPASAAGVLDSAVAAAATDTKSTAAAAAKDATPEERWRVAARAVPARLDAEAEPTGMVTSLDSIPLTLGVGSGIEDVVSNPVRPIRTVHFENPTERLADSPTASRSLS